MISTCASSWIHGLPIQWGLCISYTSRLSEEEHCPIQHNKIIYALRCKLGAGLLWFLIHVRARPIVYHPNYCFHVTILRCETWRWAQVMRVMDYVHFAINKFVSLNITVWYNALPLITSRYVFHTSLTKPYPCMNFSSSHSVHSHVARVQKIFKEPSTLGITTPMIIGFRFYGILPRIQFACKEFKIHSPKYGSFIWSFSFSAEMRFTY